MSCGIAVSCGVGHRCGLDWALLWLWCRPAALSLIGSLDWELPNAAAIKRNTQITIKQDFKIKRQKERRKKERKKERERKRERKKEREMFTLELEVLFDRVFTQTGVLMSFQSTGSRGRKKKEEEEMTITTEALTKIRGNNIT